MANDTGGSNSGVSMTALRCLNWRRRFKRVTRAGVGAPENKVGHSLRVCACVQDRECARATLPEESESSESSNTASVSCGKRSPLNSRPRSESPVARSS
jgi:hypothetical protein